VELWRLVFDIVTAHISRMSLTFLQRTLSIAGLRQVTRVLLRGVVVRVRDVVGKVGCRVHGAVVRVRFGLVVAVVG